MSATAPDQGRTYVGKYQILKHIATGGMGAVYRAIDTDSGREVALKVLSPEQAARPVTLARLRREAEVGAKLNHVNIVALYEFGQTQGTWFLAMEFVEGIDLHDQISRSGPLLPEQARRIVVQIAEGLAHIYQAGYIHRDIKPSNILLTRQDGRIVAKLADLGLVRDAEEEQHRLTREGFTVGTVDYLAPEQARDSNAADIRSDIYSLGCTLHHMLTGAPPFPDGTLVEKLFKHSDVEPPDVRLVNPKVPAAMAALCRRMLAKKPEDRPQNPAELLAGLKRLSEDIPVPDGAAPATKESLRANASGTPGATFPLERRALGQFEVAKRALLAGEEKYGLRLLRECCRLDLANLQYREALRNAELARAERGGFFSSRRVRALYYRLALNVARMLGKPRYILERGEAALTGGAQDLDVHLLMAEAAVAGKLWPLAGWLLDQAQKAHGKHVQIHRAMALYWEYQGDVAQAITCWELVDQALPENPEARSHLKNLSARHTLVRGNFKDRVNPSP